MSEQPVDAQDLDDWRQRIDTIDRELVALLNQRAGYVRRIGEAKRSSGGAIFVPHRERQVFDRVCGHNEGPMPDKALRAIWREIMSASIALEQPLRICHFASEGSFTHQAAKLKFGDSIAYSSAPAIATVFREVERGRADYGVVPIENSIDGGITDTIDAFLDSPLRIVNEIHLRIRHHLMARCERSAIKRVYSKYTVFGQCRRWLADNMPGVELIETGSTTLAAERARDEEGAAAIGNIDAAAQFDLAVLATDIEDNPTNTTRFVVLAMPERAAKASGDDKTSLMLGLEDRPGALFDALSPFHAAGITLTRIESRPSRRRAWEYLFFADLIGHEDTPEVGQAIAQLQQQVTVLQILGSYPRVAEPLNG